MFRSPLTRTAGGGFGRSWKACHERPYRSAKGPSSGDGNQPAPAASTTPTGFWDARRRSVLCGLATGESVLSGGGTWSAKEPPPSYGKLPRSLLAVTRVDLPPRAAEEHAQAGELYRILPFWVAETGVLVHSRLTLLTRYGKALSALSVGQTASD